jgi:transposase-like protein
VAERKVECPLCRSADTVKTAEALLTAIYFCFSCGKSFTQKRTGQAPPSAT